jgi:hypothetical protein
MKPVTKFDTFEDLKSHERKSLNYKLSLKKHKAFEKFLKSIKDLKHLKNQSM